MESSDSKSVVFATKRTGPPDLRLLHYNDVYHVEAQSAEPVGGIARFKTLVKHYRSAPEYANQPELITLFSGDAFNPSLESSVTKGRHMVPVLNKLGTDVACVGNHDLDFGVAQFRHLRSMCNFPWLLANVLDPALGDGVPLANCEKSVIITASSGIKIGVIGLAEQEWLETINSLPPDLITIPASQVVADLAPQLRKNGAEMIVAITHMREPNDNRLAEEVHPGMVDIILGGHDHYYSHSLINGTHVLRSGTDFKQLSYIEARRKEVGQGWDFDILRRDVISSIQEDAEMVSLMQDLTESLKSKLEKPIGYTASPLDGRFTTVRTRESNLGNFVSDLMRLYYGADCAIMAGGTIRGDQVYPPGLLRLKDLLNCFPFEDPVVVLKASGQAIFDALENSVSKIPALEGRFAQVSKIRYSFSTSAPSGSRILWVEIDGSPLDRKKLYTLATRGYMGRGKDGYDSLLVKSAGGEVEEIVSEENGVLISTILRQYFMELKVLGRWCRLSKSLQKHLGTVHSQIAENDGWVKQPNSLNAPPPAAPKHSRTGSVKRNRIHVDGHPVDSDSEDESDSHIPPVKPEAVEIEWRKNLARQVTRKWMRIAGIKHENVGLVGDHDEEFLPHWTRGIAPKLEGRIVVVTDN